MIAVSVLAGAAFLAFYILLGYPLVLGFLRFRMRPPVRKDPSYTPTVCALIAVHNGEAFLRAKLESLLAMEYPSGKFSILVVSDGSTDATEEIAREFRSRDVRLMVLPRAGKPAGISAALAAIDAEVILYTDVRQAFDRMALRHLTANLADPTVGAVTGELAYLEESGHGEQATLDLYWRYELWARRKHSEIDSLFNTTGAIYAARRELVRPIPADTLADDAVIPLTIYFQGFRVVSEPAAVAWDRRALTDAEFGRKVRTMAGVWPAFARLPKLFAPHRMWLHFLSHKFGRLILPWTLLMIVGATFALPESPLRATLIWNEAALAALALLAPLVPERLPLRRIFSAARTFLVMNFAAAKSIQVFFRPAEKIWALPTTNVRPLEKKEAAPR